MSLKTTSGTDLALSLGFTPKFSKKASWGPTLAFLEMGVASTLKGEASTLPLLELGVASTKKGEASTLPLLELGVASTKKGEASGIVLLITEVTDIPPSALVGDARNAVFRGDPPKDDAVGDSIGWPAALACNTGSCPR